MIITFRITNFMEIKQKKNFFLQVISTWISFTQQRIRTKKSFCIDNEYENQLSTKNDSHLGNCSNTYKNDMCSVKYFH